MDNQGAPSLNCPLTVRSMAGDTTAKAIRDCPLNASSSISNYPFQCHLSTRMSLYIYSRLSKAIKRRNTHTESKPSLCHERQCRQAPRLFWNICQASLLLHAGRASTSPHSPQVPRQSSTSMLQFRRRGSELLVLRGFDCMHDVWLMCRGLIRSPWV